MNIGDHEKLELEISQCKKCQLYKTRNNTVVYSGNTQAKLMLIGEGPGEQEDLTGKPFVGRAGQLLTKILESVDINRDTDAYICNIVKCRPPMNRVPSQEESSYCIDYLKSQIKIIQPKIILLLGSTAVKYCLKINNPKITQIHGLWLNYGDYKNSGKILLEAEYSEELKELYKNIILMPFFHPSYLLRNPSKEKNSPKWLAWKAIQEVKNKLQELN